MNGSMSHEFAFFVPQLNRINAQQNYMIHDSELVHRIAQVLRLQVGDTCMLFDSHIHAVVTIQEILKNKTINVRIIKSIPTIALEPTITFLLPVLKKEALEEAVYSLVETGVNRIVLVTTAKTQRHWSGDKELQRLQRIVIAASEQAKQFALVELIAPIQLKQALEQYVQNQKIALFFDAQGTIVRDSLLFKKDSDKHEIIALIGPEGDLVEEEKQLADTYGFVRVKLTPTILRASQAAALGAGIIRSLLS